MGHHLAELTQRIAERFGHVAGEQPVEGRGDRAHLVGRCLIIEAPVGRRGQDELRFSAWKGTGHSMELTAGQNVPVEGAMRFRLQPARLSEVDLIALILDGADQVRADDDFVFYNAPHHPSGGVVLENQELVLQTWLLPTVVQRVLIAANSERELDGLTVSISGQQGLSFTPSQLGGLPTAVMLEVYRRDAGWRIRAVGQGWAAGLAGLARDYGVHVEGDQTSAPPVPPEPVPDLAPLQAEIDVLLRKRDVLAHEVASLDLQVRKARETIVETDELRLLQQVGYYQFRHPLDDVLSSKSAWTLFAPRSREPSANEQRYSESLAGWSTARSRRSRASPPVRRPDAKDLQHRGGQLCADRPCPHR